MISTIINLQEWLERRARRLALDHLRREGWLPSGIEALISLMELPAGENGEATAMRLRDEVSRFDIDMSMRTTDIEGAG